MVTNTVAQMVVLAAKIDLESSWSKFWSAVRTQAGPILDLAAVVGVLMIVIAIAKWAWDRRRGQGGGGQSQAIWGALLVGCMFSAPAVIIPMFLLIMDVIANAAISVWQSSAGA